MNPAAPRSRECGVLLLVAVLAAACGEPAADVAQRKAQRIMPVSRPTLPLPIGAHIAPDSGQLTLGTIVSIWRSSAAPSGAVHVSEEIQYSARSRGLRRYEFDSTGTLVYFSELERRSHADGDSVRDGGKAWIEFAGGKPVMLSRVSSAGTRMHFARHELHNIAKRAYMLWDSAVLAP